MAEMGDLVHWTNIEICEFVTNLIIIGFFVPAIMSIGSIATPRWCDYQGGHRGLWEDCQDTNKTDADGAKIYNCDQTVLADGPVFLNTTRTLMILGIGFLVTSMFSFPIAGCVKKARDINYTEMIDLGLRILALSFFLRAVCGIAAAAVYGNYYYDYHTKVLDLPHPELSIGFHLNVVSSAMTLFMSFCYVIYTKFKQVQTSIRKMKSSIKDAGSKAKTRLQKLQVKPKLSRGANRKVHVMVVGENKKGGTKKSTNLTKYVLPITLFQAARRVQEKAAHRLKDMTYKNQKCNELENEGTKKDCIMNGQNVFTIHISNDKDISC